MTASGLIFLAVILDAAAIASVIVAVLWMVIQLDSVVTKRFTRGGD